MKSSFNKEKFAQRLKDLCEEKTVYQVSKETKIPSSSLYRYISCQREIGINLLCRLADYFDVTLDYLTGRTDY